jgi:hypothetical protein
MSKELMSKWLFNRTCNSACRPDPMSFFRDRRLLPQAG